MGNPGTHHRKISKKWCALHNFAQVKAVNMAAQTVI
jgi:hypothetical protein